MTLGERERRPFVLGPLLDGDGAVEISARGADGPATGSTAPELVGVRAGAVVARDGAVDGVLPALVDARGWWWWWVGVVGVAGGGGSRGLFPASGGAGHGDFFRIAWFFVAFLGVMRL
jgi:hypothetical protein